MEFQMKEQTKSISPNKQISTNSTSSIDAITPTKSTNCREKRIFTNGTLSSIANSSSLSSISQANQVVAASNTPDSIKAPNLITPTKLIPIKLLSNNDLLATTTKQSCVPALNSLINKLNNYQQHIPNVITPSCSSSSGSSSGTSSTSSSTSSFKLNNEIHLQHKNNAKDQLSILKIHATDNNCDNNSKQIPADVSQEVIIYIYYWFIFIS